MLPAAWKVVKMAGVDQPQERFALTSSAFAGGDPIPGGNLQQNVIGTRVNPGRPERMPHPLCRQTDVSRIPEE